MIQTRLKELRQKLGITQDELGHALGISKSGISSIENGARALSDKHIKLLLVSYPYVNETWLRTGEGKMFEQSDQSILGELTTKFSLDDLDVRILEAYLKLPASQRAVIKNFIAGLAVPADPIQMELDAYRAELEAEQTGKTSSPSAESDEKLG